MFSRAECAEPCLPGVTSALRRPSPDGRPTRVEPTALSSAIAHLGATIMDFVELGTEDTTSMHFHAWDRGIPLGE
jgi:hypothetical protein